MLLVGTGVPNTPYLKGHTEENLNLYEQLVDVIRQVWQQKEGDVVVILSTTDCL